MMMPTRTVLLARRSLLAQARPLSRGFATSLRLREYLFYLWGRRWVFGASRHGLGSVLALCFSISGNAQGLTTRAPR